MEKISSEKEGGKFLKEDVDEKPFWEGEGRE